MNKKSNANNIKSSVNTEISKMPEENKKQSTNMQIDNKDKKIIEELKYDQTSNKTKKDTNKNKILSVETDDKLVAKEEKPQISKIKENSEKSAKNHNQLKKQNLANKVEINSQEESNTRTVLNKKNITDQTEKINKQSNQSKVVDPETSFGKTFSKEFEEYIENSGLTLAFELIFSEITTKNIKQENQFQYTAIRLRQIGKELEDLRISKP